MVCRKLVQIKDKAPKQALESLNRVTGLNWDRHPASLLPGGLIINGSANQEEDFIERKRA
jgi:hypothetical protein